MSKLRTCHLPHITGLFCTSSDLLDQARTMQSHGANIVVSDMTELGGRQ